MTAPQTVAIDGRTYIFTDEGANDGAALRILGSLHNSRGAFTGYVVQNIATGGRLVFGGLKNVPPYKQRAALAALEVTP